MKLLSIRVLGATTDFAVSMIQLCGVFHSGTISQGVGLNSNQAHITSNEERCRPI